MLSFVHAWAHSKPRTWLPLATAVSAAMLLGTIGITWQAWIKTLPVLTGDQLNIATFALAANEPSSLARDFPFGSGNPSAFYTPLQLQIVWWLWQITGSPTSAFGVQLPLLAAMTIWAGCAAGWILSRSIPGALLAGIAATLYRPLPSVSEIWGLGPWESILPRAWAGPFVMLAIALWIQSMRQHTSLDHRLSGKFIAATFVAGICANFHPPSGVTLGAVLFLATALRHIVTPAPRRSVQTALLATGAYVLGAGPFVLGYVSNAAPSLAGVPWDEYLSVVRYRVPSLLMPELVTGLGRAVDPEAAGFLGTTCAAVAALMSWGIIWRHERNLATSFAFITVAVVLATIVAGVILQLLFLALHVNPVLTIDLVRGARLLVPIFVLISGCAVARLLVNPTPPAVGAAAVVATLILLTELPDRVSVTWVSSVIGPVAIGCFVGLAARRLGNPLPNAVAIAAAVVLVSQPAATLARDIRLTTRCCTPPPPSLAATETDEVLMWIRTLPVGVVIDTTAVPGSLPLLVRVEAKHAVTLALKDGGVLLHADPIAALTWHKRALRAPMILANADVDELTANARGLGADAILLDLTSWRGEVGPLVLFRNARYVVVGL
jgi:hypothetical protein